MDADAAAQPDETRPPAASTLQQLPPDLWATLVPAARSALHGMDEAEVTPRVRQLRATPTGRLAGGRSRRDLCRVLTEDGGAWRAVADELRGTPGGRELLDVLARGELPAPGEPGVGPREDGPSAGAVRDLRDREARLRARNRELAAERDDARRRAGGLEARLGTERGRLAQLRAELEELRAEREDLLDRMRRAREDHERTAARLRRQHESELGELREELRQHRRREEERQRERRREEERAQRSQERAPSGVAPRGPAPRRQPSVRATPGRPSRLPPGVAAGTTEAASALLGAVRLVIIDGYNVTKQRHGHLPLEQQRLWLERLAAGLAARRTIQPTIVFDGRSGGQAPARPQRWVRVVFSTGGSADDVIVEMVERLPADEPVAVVTDDRELRARVERLGADVVPTRNFIGVAG